MHPPTDHAPGALLVHRLRPAWGVGEVTSKLNDRLCVRFADDVRTFVLTSTPPPPLEAAPAGSTPPTPIRRSSARKPGSSTTTPGKPRPLVGAKAESRGSATFDLAWAKFQGEFGGLFADPKYLSMERDEKWNAHLEFEKALGRGQGEKLLADGPGGHHDELVAHLLRIARSVAFMSPFEQTPFANALQHRTSDPTQPPASGRMDAAAAYAGALFDLLGAARAAPSAIAPEMEAPFTRYCRAVAGLPVVGKLSPNKWPCAMTLPAVALPDKFLMLKPESAKSMAACLDVQLNYAAAPNWLTFTCLIKMGEDLLERLRPHGAKDFIDVQSFMWVDWYYGKDG